LIPGEAFSSSVEWGIRGIILSTYAIPKENI